MFLLIFPSSAALPINAAHIKAQYIVAQKYTKIHSKIPFFQQKPKFLPSLQISPPQFVDFDALVLPAAGPAFLFRLQGAHKQAFSSFSALYLILVFR